MRAFLNETNVFLDSLTGYFHLVNTSRTALQVLTDQVRRIVDAGADDAVISALFPLAEKTTGQNLRAYTLEDESAKDTNLAEMWLFAIFARYEAWAGVIEKKYGIEKAARGCQFPGPTGNGDYQSVFGSLVESESLAAAFGTVRNTSEYFKSDESTVEALHIYRYYKEVRNSLIHSGGETLERVANAAVRAAQASETLKSNGDEVVQISALEITEEGFSNISFEFVRDVIWLVQKLAATIDLKILLSEAGSGILVDRWKSVHGAAPMKLTQRKRTSRTWYLHQVSKDISLPRPPGTNDDYWPTEAQERFLSFGIEKGILRMLP